MTTLGTDLHAVAFFMADHASVESGKVYANGAFFTRLRFATFPAVSNFSVVVVIEVPWREHHAPHSFSIRFEDADARPLFGDLQGEFRVGTAPDAKVGDQTLVPMAAAVTNCKFPNPGDYVAVLRIDGAEAERLAFRVVQVPADPGRGAGV